MDKPKSWRVISLWNPEIVYTIVDKDDMTIVLQEGNQRYKITLKWLRLFKGLQDVQVWDAKGNLTRVKTIVE